MSSLVKVLFVILLIILHGSLYGQEQLSRESMLSTVKDIVKNDNDYGAGISILNKWIENNPTTDIDSRLYLSRLLFWNNQTTEAEEVLSELLLVPDASLDAYILLADVYDSQSAFSLSNEVLDKALIKYPQDGKLRYRKAYCEMRLRKYHKAEKRLKSILKSDSTNEKAAVLLNEIQNEYKKNIVSIGYQNLFLKSYNLSTKLYNLSYGRRFNNTTVIAGASWLSTNQQLGLQSSIDVYQVISNRIYGYFQLSKSRSQLHPELRLSTALYYSSPSQFTYSVFGTYIRIDQSEVYILSPRLEKVIGGFTLKGSTNYSYSNNLSEWTYRGILQYNINRINTIVGIGLGTFSSEEIINNYNEMDFSTRYFTLNLKTRISRNASLSMTYNKNVSRNAISRDLFSLHSIYRF